MKSFIPCLLIMLSALIIASCKKNTVAPPAKIAVQSNWKLASDTLVIGGKVDWAYQGVSGDYYNFASDGKLYVNQGNGQGSRDTVSYTVNGDTSVTLTKMIQGSPEPWYGFNNPWKVTVLTAHKMVFTAGVAQSGAGWEQETITLSK